MIDNLSLGIISSLVVGIFLLILAYKYRRNQVKIIIFAAIVLAIIVIIYFTYTKIRELDQRAKYIINTQKTETAQIEYSKTTISSITPAPTYTVIPKSISVFGSGNIFIEGSGNTIQQNTTSVPTLYISPTLEPTQTVNISECSGKYKKMMFIGTGDFNIGSTPDEIIQFAETCPQDIKECSQSNFLDEVPVKSIHLSSFCIDKYEVSNSDFSIFVSETKYITTAEKKGYSNIWNEMRRAWDEQIKNINWKNPRNPNIGLSRIENHPVVHISWYDAMAYCKWMGKRLPTEEEWEVAARGPGRFIYPWGNNWDPLKVNYYGESPNKTSTIDSHLSGMSPYGVVNMEGNVSEWTSTIELGTDDKPLLIELRGGGFATAQVYLHTAWRHAVPPEITNSATGFRCAVSIDS